MLDSFVEFLCLTAPCIPLQAVRRSKARELREKEIADQAYLREKRDQFHRRSQAIIMECLTKFRCLMPHYCGHYDVACQPMHAGY